MPKNRVEIYYIIFFQFPNLKMGDKNLRSVVYFEFFHSAFPSSQDKRGRISKKVFVVRHKQM